MQLDFDHSNLAACSLRTLPILLLRTLKWTASAVLALVILTFLFIALFGWNWLRAPLERQVLTQTGRVLSIQGDLGMHLGWPWPRLHAAQVTFANPAWAAQANMLKADEVALSIHLPQLLAKRLVISDLHLVKPIVFLERHSDGRKTWLLDRQQQDETARIDIDRLTLDQGLIGFDDVASQTSLRAELSSLPRPADGSTAAGVSFSAKGKYKGLPLVAKGTGDSVLALRDDSTPFGLSIDTTVGQTHVRAEGHVTNLLKFSSIDMQLALSGDNLDQLFTLTGIATPATRDYVTQGHLLRKGNSVRYESFTGRVGTSDLSGWIAVRTGGKRPMLTADLVSKRLTLEDLGPVIGARPGKLQAAIKAVEQPARLRR